MKIGLIAVLFASALLLRAADSLHDAVYRDDLEATARLLDQGADAALTNRYGIPPLALACANRNAAMAELLLKRGADPKAVSPGGETILMTAARTGNPTIVRALLQAGAEVNAKERRNQTAIMWAAAEGHTEVVELLIAAGAELKQPLDTGFSPLTFAIREGHKETAFALIRAGAEVNSPMEPKRGGGRAVRKGTTPFILAVENAHFELALALIDKGADPNDERSGYTALHVISWVRKPNRGDNEEDLPPPDGSGNVTSLEFVKKLAAHGANVNARLKRGASGKGQVGRTGATPFLLAAANADLPLMKTLLELGADPKIPNAENSNALHAAAGLGVLAPGEEAGTEEEAIESTKFMLALGFEVNTADSNGETPMHCAAYKSSPRLVKLLAESGAKPELWNHPNKWGWTPISIAEGYRPGNFRPSAETLAALQDLLHEVR